MKKLLCMLALFSNTVTFSMLPPLEASCTDGRTPLIMAILRGTFINEDFIEKYKTTINVQDDSGRTALHHAAANGQKDIIRLLVAYGAQRLLQDREGKTAEDIATERKKIRAQSESHSYEHSSYQEPILPHADEISENAVALLHCPGSTLHLSKEQCPPDTSCNKTKSTLGYYASLI